MPKTKIAITLDQVAVNELDRLVREAVYSSRSAVIQQAVAEKLERLGHGRLARESAKLDPDFERDLAEEGLTEDAAGWPDY